MSYNVLVIPEDPTKDAAVLKPLAEKLLADLGKPRAKVEVCRDPSFGGISQCLDANRLKTEVIDVYKMVNLFLLLVDRDGNTGRARALTHLETEIRKHLTTNQRFFAEHAWQEVEIFILAGFRLRSGWTWGDIREDPDLKNTYFAEFAKEKQTTNQPHEGRKSLMAESIQNWTRIKNRCPEDVQALLQRMNGQL